MDWEPVIIIFASCIGAATIILSFGVLRWMAPSGGGGKKGKAETNEEARMIQEIHHGLTRMEERVEALETLLLDEDRKKRRDFDSELNRS